MNSKKSETFVTPHEPTIHFRVQTLPRQKIPPTHDQTMQFNLDTKWIESVPLLLGIQQHVESLLSQGKPGFSKLRFIRLTQSTVSAFLRSMKLHVSLNNVNLSGFKTLAILATTAFKRDLTC